MTTLPVKIPKLIHQTWKTKDVPEKWLSSYVKYKALEAEGWEYKLWTDEDNRRLIQSDFPWFLSQFDSYPYAIQRADAIRYFILYKYGGIYSDLDIQPKSNFSAFYDMYKHYDLALPTTKSGNAFAGQNFTNCFMMSSKGCAFWPIVWEHLKSPMKSTKKWWKSTLFNAPYFHVLFSTGPGIVCDAADEYKGEIVRIPVQLIQPGVEKDTDTKQLVSCPESVVELLEGKSWHQADANIWRVAGSVMNNASWILLGISMFLFIIILVMSIRGCRKCKEKERGAKEDQQIGVHEEQPTSKKNSVYQVFMQHHKK